MASCYRIVPSNNCKHIEGFKFDDSKEIDAKGKCSQCANQDNNWMCLFCLEIFCGRDANQHMIAHNQAQKDHCCVVSLDDFSFWCYECDKYIQHDSISLQSKFFNALHISKHGGAVGQVPATREDFIGLLEAASVAKDVNTEIADNTIVLELKDKEEE